ncbi:hypothetical protein [Litoribacillus peritrichatus]|uniref:Preprotein translocase subunit SecA n=1 Tax=Litoribacillus peritrichatus TaxID=718191 RepID=A0ABP7M5M0_9GAMM
MSEHIHLEKFKQGSQDDRRFVTWDIIMMLVLFSNLTFLVVDALLTWDALEGFWMSFPGQGLDLYYEYVSPHFLLIDGAFVAFFLTEFCVRWAISLHRKEYPGWFFFPLFHWYDLLGCIPLAEFRWLRLLRIVSVLIRLHRMGVIDLKNNFFYRRVSIYHDILVEEVSDKVVLNVLNGVQSEFDKDYPLGKRIVDNVFAPHKTELIRWIASGVEGFITEHYQLSRDKIQDDIRKRVELAIENQREMQTLERLPVIGDKISQEIQRLVSDVAWQVLDGLINDIATDGKQPDMDLILDALVSSLGNENQKLHELTRNMSIQTIEEIKRQVAIKNWKAEVQASVANPGFVKE